MGLKYKKVDNIMNVYDFDKTIYSGDSTTAFFLFSLKRHPSVLCLIPSIFYGFIKYYVFKKGTKTQFKQRIMYFVKKIDYKKDITDFWKKNKRKIKKYYIDQKKETDVIISASPAFVIEPVCKELGIKNIIASPVDVKTGEYTGENCHGKEKVRRFREVFGNCEIHEFYSDSYSDTPLAEIADKAYMVKGDEVSPWIFKD